MKGQIWAASVSDGSNHPDGEKQDKSPAGPCVNAWGLGSKRRTPDDI